MSILMNKTYPMPATLLCLSLALSLSVGLLASVLAPAARAQGLESGVGSGPSEQLAVPPNRRNDPDFTYGRTATRQRTAHRHAKAAARTTADRASTASTSGH